jgi:sterol 14-demethylase
MFNEFSTLFPEIEKGMSFISILFPYIPIAKHRRHDKALVKLRGMLSETVRARRSSDRIKEDAMQRLIDSKYKDGRSMTEAEITGMIMTLIFAGKHTSAHASTWTGACLLSNVKCLVSAMEEQKKIIIKHEDQVDYNVLLEMETLHNCIKEALRMHPTAPLLVR